MNYPIFGQKTFSNKALKAISLLLEKGGYLSVNNKYLTIESIEKNVNKYIVINKNTGSLLYNGKELDKAYSLILE